MNTEYKVGDLIYDAPIYDGLNTFLSDLAFYEKWLPTDKKGHILELCCGSGRLTIPLAKAHHMCGVDNAVSMLAQAKRKASQAEVTIDFVEADIRTLNLPQKFDVIIIPFNSIHHLYTNQDLFDTLTVVKKHLKDGGLFLFDCYNPNIQFIVEAEKALNTMADYVTEDGRKVLIKQTMSYESRAQINRIEWHYFINDQFHSIQNVDMRLYFPQELDTYLKMFGFTIMHKFGNFEEEAFTNASEKQVFICK
ncbi:MAG: SAM-dependent methyltransferase [Flavobacterium sp. BFFFF2]|nr:MAG: SAM-dependent methyltransferase [Flavobacterium sp. BFFFF2]